VSAVRCCHSAGNGNGTAAAGAATA
jgi:hypothetical protein